MVDLYRLASAPGAFACGVDDLGRAAQRLGTKEDLTELEGPPVLGEALAPAGRRAGPRSNIAAQLSMLTSMFDDPALRRAFLSIGGGTKTFSRLRSSVGGRPSGRALTCPRRRVGEDGFLRSWGTLVKLNFQGAVLAAPGSGPKGPMHGGSGLLLPRGRV